MGLSSTISEEMAIPVENQFFHPVYLTPPPKGSPCHWVLTRLQKRS